MKPILVPAPFALLLLLPLVPGAQGSASFVNWETPHVSPLAMTPDGARLLMVNLPDARLEVFDLSGSLPVREAAIPVGLDPVSVRARTNTEVWVVNHVSDSVSVVDLTLPNVVATLDTDDEPADVVFAGNPERAFVTCSQANTVLVFDPANLAAAPVRIEIRGEDPRALAVSPDGSTVYAAIFESGNRSTILGGGIADGTLAFPPNVVSDAAGPYGGVNPPPNDGGSFSPPLANGLPTPPKVGLIVKQDAAGRWMDDNGGDWTDLVSGADAAESGRPVGWTLLDHDVAVIDAGTLTVSYVDHLMNLDMALAVNPATGHLGVVGTDATNEIRFEPNLTGTFVRTTLALVDPASPGTPTLVDVNTHLTYATSSVSQSERDKTLADPRGIAFNAAGTRAWISGMGSNNVILVDAAGARVGIAPTVEVGPGPTGLVLDEARDRLYVLNKFETSLSVVDTVNEAEIARVKAWDPTPPEFLAGRRHLYDARATSGLGLTACAACHVDARMDRLAWDLGDPSGSMKSTAGQNAGAGIAALGSLQDFHPMKGPMLTQTMQDIIGKEPHHWRGDRTGIEEFNPAFVGLLGDDQMLTPTQMQEFEDFLASIHFPPNPYRTDENDLPTSLDLTGHFHTGRQTAAGTPLPTGNAVAGLGAYTPPRLLDARGLACVTCHTLPTGLGTNHLLNQIQGEYVPIPPGPDGELHHMLVSVDGSTNVSMKVPQLRNLYERTGFDLTQLENTAGFGFLHDGSVDSLARFVNEPVFDTGSAQELADVVAFMLAFSGSNLPSGSTTNPFQPPGTASQDTHALVGRQATLVDGANPAPGVIARIDGMLARADAGEVAVVAKGLRQGLARGWSYLGGGWFQADRFDERVPRATLLAATAPGSEITFTVVPRGTETRMGLDRDEDRSFDRDELDAGTDPADPESRPKQRKARLGRRPTGVTDPN